MSGSVRTITVSLWEKEFWMAYPDAQSSLSQTYERQSLSDRLLKFSDPKISGEVFGIEQEQARKAFGDPRSIGTTQEGVEVWIYYPWQDHPDWELPVYFRDARLIGVGSIHPAAFGDSISLLEAMVDVDVEHKEFATNTIRGIRGVTDKEELMRRLETKEYQEEDLIQEERGRAPLGVFIETELIPLQNTYCDYARNLETNEISVFRCQDQWNRELFVQELYKVEGVRYKDLLTQQELLLPLVLVRVVEDSFK